MKTYSEKKYWLLAKKLEGKTLYTPKRQTPFEIVKVSDTSLKLRRRTGTTYSYAKKMLEACCDHKLNGGEITVASLHKAGIVGKDKGEYSYLPAIIDAICNPTKSEMLQKDNELANRQEIKDEIKRILIPVARSQDSFIYYSDVTNQIKSVRLDPNSPEFHALLGEISQEEYKAGRAMLSAIVINRDTKIPGSGFFSLAIELGYKVNDPDAFWLAELDRVRKAYKNPPPANSQVKQVPENLWIELYWPEPERDLSILYLWFHENNKEWDLKIKDGDRVLFYETERHPDENYTGAQRIFASGTVMSQREYIPVNEQLRGGKKWIFKRRVKPDCALVPEEGILLNVVKKILGYKGWPQSGFQVQDPKKFELLEQELWRRNEINNEARSSFNRKQEREYEERVRSQFKSSGKLYNPDERLAALEKADHAHREILNKLNRILRNQCYKTSDNQQVDLFAIIEDADWIFEVKSTHDANFLSQIRHGIAQLFEYRYLYRSKTPNVNLCLVVQTAPPEKLRWIIEYLEQLGIQIWWPIPRGFNVGTGKPFKFLAQDG